MFGSKKPVAPMTLEEQIKLLEAGLKKSKADEMIEKVVDLLEEEVETLSDPETNPLWSLGVDPNARYISKLIPKVRSLSPYFSEKEKLDKMKSAIKEFRGEDKKKVVVNE